MASYNKLSADIESTRRRNVNQLPHSRRRYYSLSEIVKNMPPGQRVIFGTMLLSIIFTGCAVPQMVDTGITGAGNGSGVDNSNSDDHSSGILAPREPPATLPVSKTRIMASRETPVLGTAEATPTISPTRTPRPPAIDAPDYRVEARPTERADDLFIGSTKVASYSVERSVVSIDPSRITDAQVAQLMIKNKIGLVFKDQSGDTPDELFRIESGILIKIPIPQQVPTPMSADDFWFDADSPKNPHAIITEPLSDEKVTRTHVIFDDSKKVWVEVIENKPTGRVVYDPKKDATAVGGPVPKVTETVVTVTPQVTPRLEPTKPAVEAIFGDPALDASFAKMQEKLPDWRSGMVSYPALGGRGAPATFAELVGISKLPGAGSNWYEVRDPNPNGSSWSCLVNVMPEKVPAGMRPGTPVHVFRLSRNGALVEAVDTGEVITPSHWKTLIGKKFFFMVADLSPKNNGKIFEINSYDNPMLGIGVWK